MNYYVNEIFRVLLAVLPLVVFSIRVKWRLFTLMLSVYLTLILMLILLPATYALSVANLGILVIYLFFIALLAIEYKVANHKLQ